MFLKIQDKVLQNLICSLYVAFYLDHTLPNECVLLCSKANVKIVKPFWSSEKYIEDFVNGETIEHDFPHPVAAMGTNFVNSTGLRYAKCFLVKIKFNLFIWVFDLCG